ncbi:MAG: hypothetical protein NUV46_00600 [Nanoarchaeota archaeon]|nr:hypothetical protein [Nanoarchaeota archaeon]
MIIKIEYINGQSFYPRELFSGEFFFSVNELDNLSNKKEIGKLITLIIGGGYFFPNEKVYLKCKESDLKSSILVELIKENSKLEIVNEPNKPAGNFGFNVYVEEPTQKELQIQRNQLNRRIATLKKVEFKRE